jgi:hypothetical protein
LPRADRRQLHAALEGAGAQPHEGDAVAVLRVHIGLHLEDEAGHIRPWSGEIGAGSLGCSRGGGAKSAMASISFAHAEQFERGAEIDRRQVAMPIGLKIEFGS